MTNDVRSWGSMLPKDETFEDIQGQVVLGMMSLFNNIGVPCEEDIELVVMAMYFPEHYDTQKSRQIVKKYAKAHGNFIHILFKHWITRQNLWTPFTGYLSFDGPYSDAQEFLEYFIVEMEELREEAIAYKDERTPPMVREFIKAMIPHFDARIKECEKIVSVMTISDGNVYPLKTTACNVNVMESA